MIISMVGVTNQPDLFPRFEQNMNESYAWQMAVIGGFMSVAAFIALLSIILKKTS